MLLLFVAVFLFGETFLLLGDETLAVGNKEGLEVGEQVLLGDAQVPIQQEEELAFHEVDLGEGEAEVVEPLHCGVTGPVFVLGARVVEVLGGEDEGGKEDAVDSAAHALCDWW